MTAAIKHPVGVNHIQQLIARIVTNNVLSGEWVNDGLILLPDILDKAWKVIKHVVSRVGSIPSLGTKNSPVVEWLAHISDKDEMEVQFFPGEQNSHVVEGLARIPIAMKWKFKYSHVNNNRE